MLDLVGAVESGLHMAVVNVPPRKSTLQGLTRTRALHIHAKEHQLRVRHSSPDPMCIGFLAWVKCPAGH